MSLRLSKDAFYQILFALVITVTYLNIYELTFAVWCLAALVTIKKKYSLTLIKYVMCFVVIFAVAFIAAFFHRHSTYNYLRDISYLIKPIIGLVLGYQLCRSHNINPVKTIIYTGLIIAIGHLLVIGYAIVVYRIINMHNLRTHGGFFSDFEFYALLLVIFNKKFEYYIPPKKRKLLLLIIGVSSFLYLARANFLQFIIIYLTLKGYFEVNKRSLIVMSTFIIAGLSGYFVIYNMSLSRNGTGAEAFLYKIKNAPIEAFKTKINVADYRDFNDNYRSYENIITVRQVSAEGVWGVLFGKGMGATIDVGQEIWTNDGEWIRYIPVLHNGFMTVFLKAGLAGVFLNLLFIILLYRQGDTYTNINRQIALLLKGTAIYLVFSNWVLLGLYLKLDNKSVLIGFLMAYSQLISRQAKLKNQPIVTQ